MKVTEVMDKVPKHKTLCFSAPSLHKLNNDFILTLNVFVPI